MSDKMNDSEKAFAKWLDRTGFYYIYVEQSLDSFSEKFKEENIKRPDFLVGFLDVGLIAVDVKDKDSIFTKHNKIFLNYEDVKRAMGFERAFHIPFWYAITSGKQNKYNAWYIISARKVFNLLEPGESSKNKYVFKNKKNGEWYFSIPPDKFLLVDSNHKSLRDIVIDY